MVGVTAQNLSLNRKQRRAVASCARRALPRPEIRQSAFSVFGPAEPANAPEVFVRMGNVQAEGVELGSVATWQKDVLRPGRFSTSDGVKNFSASDLSAIVASFNLAKTRGVQVPVIMAEAGADDQHDELAGHKVGEVEDLWVDADGVMMSKVWTASKTKTAVYQLDLLKQNTSPEIWRNWTDGAGNVYPLFLKHFAIVTHPVVHPQGSFVRLSLNRRIKMAADSKSSDGSGDEGAAGPQFTGASTLTEVFENLKTSLTDLGLLIPDDITADNLVASLQLMASIKRASEEPAESETAAAGGTTDAAAMSNQPQPAATMALIASKDARIKELECAAKLQAQNAFRGALSGHVKRGAIHQAKANELVVAGERMAFSIDFLAPLEAIPDGTAFPVGKTKVASMASGKPPVARDDASVGPTKELVDAHLARLGYA